MYLAKYIKYRSNQINGENYLKKVDQGKTSKIEQKKKREKKIHASYSFFSKKKIHLTQNTQHSVMLPLKGI